MLKQDKTVEVRDVDGVLWLTLNRPERLNAITPDLLASLVRGLGEATAEHRAVVLRGNGRAFCAGYDLKHALEQAQSSDHDIHAVRASAELIQNVTRRIRTCPVPVIGAIHGFAVGGGSEFAFSCDIVVATRSARFGFPETGAGLSVTNAMTSMLPRIIGPAKAKDLVLTGEQFGADEAAAMGLVSRVVEDDELDAAVEAVLEQLGTRVPFAVRLAKKLIDAGLDRSVSEALDAEVEAAVLAETSPTAMGAFEKFAEAR